MNQTTNAAPLNVDESSSRPLFGEADLGEGERWYTVILGDLLPEWGEGETRHIAVKDLAESLWHLHHELHDWPDDKLAEHLLYQKQFLCTVARAFGKHS